MPKITGPIQRVRPAQAQKRPIMTQVRAAKFQLPRTATRAAISSTGQSPGRAPAITVAPPPSATSTASCTCGVCTGLQCLDRTRFFAGQLLTDADLTNEQNYMLAKNRLHNRYLNGWGVVCGLQVTCSECAGWVNVGPGYAIDPCGNDIIVCAAQGFNVIQAIQACCTPPPSAGNCSPLRYSPPPTCTSSVQKWCITVQYQEQATQMVTPLQQTSSSSSCGCGGSSSGCGCGCSGSSSQSNGCGCGCLSMSSSSCSTTTSSTTAGCEPTRIVEGFQFGICALPTDTSDVQPGTFFYQIEQCITNLLTLGKQYPVLVNNPSQTPAQNAQQWAQQVTNYLVNVQQYFVQTPMLTSCKALNALNNIVVPDPAQDSNIADYQAVENDVLAVLIVAGQDCLCVAALPQCPPNPCDNRVPIACVSVQNGVIQSVCHFECRQQLITFTSLQYWFQPLFAALWALVSTAIENFCCGGAQRDPGRLVPLKTAFNSANFSTAGFTNAAMVNRTMNTYLAQKMGATLVNTVNPNLNSVDLRPFIGQSVDTLQQSIDSQFNKARANTANAVNEAVRTQLDIQYVDDDPSWDLAATAAGASFAPSAVSAGQPLTVYVMGKSIVGIEVTDPTRALQLQINSLSTTVANLQSQLNNAQTQAAAKPTKPK
jgi:hypothetical protein